MGKPLAQGSPLSGQQLERESRVATRRQPFPFGLPLASVSWACSQSTPDRCPLSCLPGSLLTHRAAQFSPASIFTMETLAMSHRPMHTPQDSVHFPGFPTSRKQVQVLGTYFCFLSPKIPAVALSLPAFPTSSSPVSTLLFPVQCALPT